MSSRLRAALALLFALSALGLAVPAADAAGVPRVKGLANAGQDWGNAKLKVRWKAVAGAKYQVRWAVSTKGLAKAKAHPATGAAAYSPSLYTRCATWYAQVRAVKAGRVGPWSAAKGLKFSNKLPGTPRYTTSGQTSSSQAQVRWSSIPYGAKYRLHWSPAPFGKWPGFDPATAPVSKTSGTIAIPLPATGPGDRFLNAAYGNPLFGQLQYSNGCSKSYRQTSWFPIFPKPLNPGNASTGNALAFGSYNVELTPNRGDVAKIAGLADNIASHRLDVVALQEANADTASALRARLASAEDQNDWESFGVGQQQVMYRSGKYTLMDSGDLGQREDGNASTPLPTPYVRLAPLRPADPRSQEIIVTSVHLEDPVKYGRTTVPQQKAATSAAASVLLRNLNAVNPGKLPMLAAGDFKGNFSAYCDEKSKPYCKGEGQPTFIRAGWLDAQGAVTKVGIQYGTVNKHASPQPAGKSGFGGRADYIVAKGFTGFSRYENVRKSYGNGSATYQSDHNLIFANLYIPFGS